MEENKMQTQIDELNRKMDLILEELGHQKRRRREMEELQEDLMIVGKDLYKSAVEEMEQVHDYINTGDMLHLFKKLLRNVRTLTNAFEQFESVKDFVEDFAPLTKDIVFDLMAKLDEYDRKGYFQFAQEFTKAFDNIVESFTVDDVKNLSDNVVTILNTVKNLTQPDMLQAINNALSVYKNLLQSSWHAAKGSFLAQDR